MAKQDMAKQQAAAQRLIKDPERLKEKLASIELSVSVMSINTKDVKGFLSKILSAERNGKEWTENAKKRKAIAGLNDAGPSKKAKTSDEASDFSS